MITRTWSSNGPDTVCICRKSYILTYDTSAVWFVSCLLHYSIRSFVHVVIAVSTHLTLIVLSSLCNIRLPQHIGLLIFVSGSFRFIYLTISILIVIVVNRVARQGRVNILPINHNHTTFTLTLSLTLQKLIDNLFKFFTFMTLVCH